jgi:hypothetical protein
MVQVTDEVVQAHECSFKAITQVFQGLGLLTAEAAQHISKVVFVVVMPNTYQLSSVKGIAVKVNNDNSPSVISWNDAMLKLKMPVEIQCEAYIVRATITPVGDQQL